jgi:transposase
VLAPYEPKEATVLRLQVGVDPAPKTCVAKVVDDAGEVHGRKLSFAPDREGIAQLLRSIDGMAPGVPRHFFVEASGYLWYSSAAMLRELGEPVSLVNPNYTKAQRRCTTPNAKSDAADAEALARVAFNRGKKALHPADIPEGMRLNLRLLARQRATVQQDATAIKLRVLAWLGLTAPGLTTILGNDLSAADREFITRYPVVGKVLRLGKERLRRFLDRSTCGQTDETTVDALFELARKAYSPRDLDSELVAEQFRLEFQRLALAEKQIGQLDKQISRLLAKCDPAGLARSLPGFGPVISAIMVAETGTDLSRFPTAKQFASWTGIVGRASGTAGKHVGGLPMTKAGRSNVKWALYMAAKSAANCDPEMAALYDKLKAKGKHHNVAVNAVGHQLARVYWAVMTEQRPYQKRPPELTAKPIDSP